MERDGGAGGFDRKVFSGGDASIFSSADGLQRLAKTRSGSRQSSRAGSEKSGRGSRGEPPRPDHSAQVNFYGAQARVSGGGAHSVSEGSGSQRGGDRRSQGGGSNRAPSTGRHPESSGRHGQGAWVRVEDVADHAAHPPTDQRRAARVPSRAASERSDDRGTQTDKDDRGTNRSESTNPNAQLRLQAALQTELRECQEELARVQMEAAVLRNDKVRLVGELEQEREKAKAARASAKGQDRPNGTDGKADGQNQMQRTESGGGLSGAGRDSSGGAPTITETEMDETVNSLLEMIASEREAKSALEHHLETATAALENERSARVTAEDELAAARADADDDADAAEQKLREATDIIGELRQALLDVMRVKDGSVNGSDGGGARRSNSSKAPKSPKSPARPPKQAPVHNPNKSRWLEGGETGDTNRRGETSHANGAVDTNEPADVYADAGRRAVVIFRTAAAKVAAHPAFELAWPLLCILLLLRFQLGPDVFTWRSMTWSNGGIPPQMEPAAEPEPPMPTEPEL